MRGSHPSHIGFIDICVIGNSEPGLTGLLTPFCETKGLFFNEYIEPESFKPTFENIVDNDLAESDSFIVENTYIEPITIDEEDE